MNTSASLPINTERLILRQFRPADLPSYADYHGREDVYRFLYASPPEKEALEAQFASMLSAPFENDGDTLRLAVVRRNDQAVVGEVLLKIASKTALQAEVGYIFNPSFSGQGYATEAVRAIISLGFDQLGCHRIFARLDTLNHGSIGIVERLKMRREAHLVQNDRFNGNWGDEFIYAVLKSEWHA
ncbi:MULTISPECIES: GNAT family N-acetyltransferase [unclassified Rhizobium]|uniref:GNAT family N-acetyltransferase n=1 Tax=unclassified Rhizobium TaxID=2613769 RepID=UPI00247ABFB9|nr:MULTISPECIES: GNAT family protein [unclassified Rhizobium]MDH7804478.1 RimJ/RimL family protein N-acetyltransferase [Rhizobium sp. AN70]